MFDISYSPWLILALIGLIFFRPDDWQELAFHGGRILRRMRAYVLEWQEYLEFSSVNQPTSIIEKKKLHTENKASLVIDLKIWPSKEVGSRTVSIVPYV